MAGSWSTAAFATWALSGSLISRSSPAAPARWALTRTVPERSTCPSSCGGVLVKPGFIVVGDEDGVVIIDPLDAAEVIKRTEALNANEVKTFAHIKAGTLDRSWVDKSLKEKGCEIID